MNGQQTDLYLIRREDEYKKLKAELEAVKQERDELAADAKRYRWFREVIPNVIFDSIAKTIELRTTLTLRDWDWNGEQLDEAIDAALAKLGADKTGVPVVYYPFGEVNAYTPSKQSGGNFVNPEFEIEASPGEAFKCVEGDGYNDLKTGKKLRWHDVSPQAGKKMMKPFYDGNPPKYVDTFTNEAGTWRKFTWACGYNISVKLGAEKGAT